MHLRRLGWLLPLAFLAARCGSGVDTLNPSLPGTAMAPSPAPSTSPSQSPGSIPVRAGQWGGPHLGMKVTDSGAQLDLDCAKGEIDQPLLMDGSGSFHAVGTVTYTAGPIDPEHPNVPKPATFDGVVSGDTLTMTVSYTLPAGQPAGGTYTLTYGSPGIHNVLCALYTPMSFA